MKIINICLACFYYEGLGYQENILPKYQKINGNEVYIAAMAEKYINGSKEYIEENYINEDGIPVYILKAKNKFCIKYKKYYNLLGILEEIKPDVIFIHGGQSLSLRDVLKYIKKHSNVKLYIDNHADYYNSKVNSIKSKLNAKIFLGKYLRKSVKYVDKYFGVTPWRCDYLNKVYKIPEKKIELLIMGGEDKFINLDNKEKIRSQIFEKYGIKNNDFLIVTGGKITEEKNIHILMDSVSEMNNVKLLVFGNVDNKFETTFTKSINKNTIYIGWIDSTKVYDYFTAADLVAFPGTHSVLWEQAVACKIPCIFKKWPMMDHVNIGNNCIMLDDIYKENLKDAIIECINNKSLYNKMLDGANSEMSNCFLYSNIAKKSIGEL